MRNFWSVIILLVLLLGLGLYFSKHSPVDREDSKQNGSSAGAIVASTSRSRIENKEHKFMIEAETPIVSGHVNAEAYNALAKIYVDRASEEFSRNAVEANFNIPDNLKNDSHLLLSRATIEVIANRYVATLFVREYAILGAAHPFESLETLNYDLESMRIVELSHIFENTSKALEYISAQSAEQIKSNLAKGDGAESFIYGGVAPEEANFRSYMISDDGLTFHFAQYQVAPYAAGPQKSFLTWRELRPLLTPEFKALADKR